MCKIVQTCAILHNLAGPAIEEQPADVDEQHQDAPQLEDQPAKRLRDQIAHSFFGQ